METGNSLVQNLISIIVPVYNGEAYLDRCVKSILAQTYTDWELLLMNGASTDATAALCEKWQRLDSRIHAFHETENKGVSSGRNSGLEKARGSYIFFLDADDWLLPDCLRRLYEDIQKEGVQIAGCGFLRCSDDDWKELEKKIEENDRSPKKRLIAGKDFLQEGILKQDTRCWSKLYRRELVEGHFFREDYTIGEDMLFLWETAREAKWISSSEYPGYCYYYNVSGTMLKPLRDSDIDQIRCWQHVLETLQSENEQMQAKGEKEVYDDGVISKTAAILLVSCMLVVGKFSVLSAKERMRYGDLRRRCSLVLKETMQIKGAYEGLDRSYRLKVWMYDKFPALYINLYHMLKRVTGK